MLNPSAAAGLGGEPPDTPGGVSLPDTSRGYALERRGQEVTRRPSASLSPALEPRGLSCAHALFTCSPSETASAQSEVNSKEEVIAHKGLSVCEY